MNELRRLTAKAISGCVLLDSKRRAPTYTQCSWVVFGCLHLFCIRIWSDCHKVCRLSLSPQACISQWGRCHTRLDSLRRSSIHIGKWYQRIRSERHPHFSWSFLSTSGIVFLSPPMRMSSTCTDSTALMTFWTQRMWSNGDVTKHVKPRVFSWSTRPVCHWRADCLRLYNHLLSFQTWFKWFWYTYPCSWSRYTVSSRSPYKNAPTTSSCIRSQLLMAFQVRKNFKPSSQLEGAKLSL